MIDFDICKDTRKQDSETFDEFFVRLFRNREELGLSCQEIADILNKESGNNFSECTYRKNYASMSKGIDFAREHYMNSDVASALVELKKERQRLQDQRTAYSSVIREQARSDDFKDEIRNRISNIPSIKLEERKDIISYNNGTLLAVISDLHIGLDVNCNGKIYNTEIARLSMQQYANKIREMQTMYRAKHLVIALAGDLIHGGISSTIRADSRERIIEQVKIAAEMIAQFISFNYGLFEHIDVYSCAGNHSRIYPNKKENMMGEYLDDLIPWWLEARFQDTNIVIHQEENETGYSVFDIGCRNAAIVHGHLDSINEQSIAKLERSTNHRLDYIICGHLHENKYVDVSGWHILQGGCMCGSVDDYCRQKRLNGVASQLMAYFDEDGEMVSINPIYFY